MNVLVYALRNVVFTYRKSFQRKSKHTSNLEYAAFHEVVHRIERIREYLKQPGKSIRV